MEAPLNTYLHNGIEIRITHSREDWWDVCRILKPETTWEEFEVMWSEFLDCAARHATH